MLYTVAEISNLTGLSKVSIYKRLKLKEFEPYITKKQGISYIDEIGFNLIKDSIKFNEDVETDLNNKDIEQGEEPEVATDTEDLTINKELVKTLIEQLKAKDIQIQALNDRLQQEQDLHKNTQVLFQKEQQQPQNILLLEEHLKEFDNRLMNIREQMGQRKEEESKGLFKRLFKK